MANLTVEKALDLFYQREMIGREAFEESINYAQVGPFNLPFPNFKARQEAVFLHDINHLITGYDTSKLGEAEVAAFELASGFPLRCWIGYFYAPLAFLGGVWFGPKRVWRAFKRGWGAKNACHLVGLPKSTLMSMTLEDFKARLG